MGSYCDSGGSCFTCFAELDLPETFTVFKLQRGTLLVMGATMMVQYVVGLWVRIVILVALASLVLPRWTFPRTFTAFRLLRGTLLVMGTVMPRWTSPRTTVTLFRLPRGAMLVMGATTMVQLTQASLVLRALPCGLDYVQFPLCLC